MVGKMNESAQNLVSCSIISVDDVSLVGQSRKFWCTSTL